MQRPGYVTVAMYVLLVGGVFGIFLVPFDLLYDPELLSQLSSGNLLAGESFLFLHSAIDSVLSLAAGIGIHLTKNWGRLLGGLLLLSFPLSFLIYLIVDPVEGNLYILVIGFVLFSALFVALGIALVFAERSKRFFGVVSDTKLIETPPPPPEFD